MATLVLQFLGILAVGVLIFKTMYSRLPFPLRIVIVLLIAGIANQTLGINL